MGGAGPTSVEGQASHLEERTTVERPVSTILTPSSSSIRVKSETLLDTVRRDAVRAGVEQTGTHAAAPAPSGQPYVTREQAVSLIMREFSLPLSPRAARIENPLRQQVVAAEDLGILRRAQREDGLLRPLHEAELQGLLRRARIAAHRSAKKR